MRKSRLIFQFKVTLLEIKPAIWRRFQVPASYNFWDLHVAVQDVMGWVDYHLHAFRCPELNQKDEEIGIPDDAFDDLVVLPSWEVAIYKHFKMPGDKVQYEYDFGDSWEHELLLEGILLKEKGVQYPRCLTGKRACPPEDCGGIPGYYRLLDVLKDPSDEEYESMIGWLNGHVKKYHPYDPNEFNVENIRFDNPQQRLARAFSSSN